MLTFFVVYIVKSDFLNYSKLYFQHHKFKKKKKNKAPKEM